MMYIVVVSHCGVCVGDSQRLLICFADIFFFKQKTAYEMRISDWSADVCSSDLGSSEMMSSIAHAWMSVSGGVSANVGVASPAPSPSAMRSEEHTSELQSLMRISYAVFCLKKTHVLNTHTIYYREAITDLNLNANTTIFHIMILVYKFITTQ